VKNKPLTKNDELLSVSFEILLPERMHGVRKASFSHKSVNISQFVGAGLQHHLLLSDLQRL